VTRRSRCHESLMPWGISPTSETTCAIDLEIAIQWPTVAPDFHVVGRSRWVRRSASLSLHW
jgi:hypothetical protein